MAAGRDWDATTAVAALGVTPWRGVAWRIHKARYDALDATGSRLRTGRYNRGGDLFPPEEVFAALYLALLPETALAELVRHIGEIDPEELNGYRLTEIDSDIGNILDCRDPTLLGLSLHDLCDPRDRSLTQALATAARNASAEGLLVPSATQLGHNLIVFTDRLQPGSELAVRGFRAPRLHE